MGNSSSGRWDWGYRKKPLVEMSLCLELGLITGSEWFVVDGIGTISWGAPVKSSISYYLVGRDVLTAVDLVYRYGTEPLIRQHIPLECRKLPRGGYRWYGSCPQCSQRILKLYRPKHKREFACRACHGLTYWACQNHDGRFRRMLSRGHVDPALMSVTQLCLQLKMLEFERVEMARFDRRFRRLNATREAQLARRRARRQKRQLLTLKSQPVPHLKDVSHD